MRARLKPFWAACLILLFCVQGASAQTRTDTIDAPLWPLLLGGPLETIALAIYVNGDRPPDLDVVRVESECLAHLQEALAAVSDIKVVRYTEVMLNREMHSRGVMAVVQYSVTLKKWKDTQSGKPVLIGAADWDVMSSNRVRSGPAVYSSPELFLIEPPASTVNEAMAAVINGHMDRYVITIVKASRKQ